MWHAGAHRLVYRAGHFSQLAGSVLRCVCAVYVGSVGFPVKGMPEEAHEATTNQPRRKTTFCVNGSRKQCGPPSLRPRSLLGVTVALSSVQRMNVYRQL